MHLNIMVFILKVWYIPVQAKGLNYHYVCIHITLESPIMPEYIYIGIPLHQNSIMFVFPPLHHWNTLHLTATFLISHLIA